ncbi:MAG TPA: phosphoglycerate dehydrogenase [Candidatus Hydrogenedentes bacterium]|nr:phosphoglycerate dehydrogenase [Candidatus Hydrogenedentota bacterium]
MPKILVLDGTSEEAVTIFKKAGFEVDVKPPQKPPELAAIIGSYDGVVVRSATKVTAEALKAPGNLKVIGRAGAGTDNIDNNAATQAGVVVMNTPGGNTISTCEHAFALLFALCRNIPSAHQSMQEGRWDRKKYMGNEICGKTLGIVGMGRIGGAVAKRAQAFDMKIITFDPILTQLKAEALGVELVSIDELVERSDFITIHAPKSEKTNNMIRLEQFKRMKPSCRIINCARGGIVNEQDLATALKDHIIAGAALDVYTSEPFENNPFIGLDNIIMTPHLAASTDEAQLNVAIDVANQMVDFLTTGAIVNAVNVPSLDSETRKALQPMLFLADRLGQFQSMFCQGRPESIEISYSGEIGVTDTYPITAAILTGFLAPVVETVNMISAPAQLKERGIASSEKRSATPSSYAFEIAVTVATDKEKHTVTGTLFHKTDPRICLIDGSRVDAKPEGNMLICINEDKPLVLGRVCTAIGEAGVNIANLMLGRDERGGHALTVLNLDQAISDQVLAKVRDIPHVNEVRLVTLPETN